MSVLAVIYKQIEQQLYTVLTPSSTPALVWIDLYNNQDIAFKEGATNHELPITFPNALIAFGEIEWETDARNNLKQQGTAQLHIYIGQEFYQDSYLNNSAAALTTRHEPTSYKTNQVRFVGSHKQRTTKFFRNQF